jgi:hypothetical protein
VLLGCADRQRYDCRHHLALPVTHQFFFILGQPRSRTAWLANWFTTEYSFCLHDPWRFANTPEQLRTYLMQVAPDKPYLGAAGSMDMIQFIELCNEFGLGMGDEQCEGSVAYVQRDPDDVYQSGLKMDLGLSPQELRGAVDRHHFQFRTMPSFVYTVQFKDLDKAGSMRELHEFLNPEIPFDLNRYRNLNDFKVEIIMDKYKTRMREGKEWLNSLQ